MDKKYIPKILVIDDNKINLLLVKGILDSFFSIFLVQNSNDTFNELEKQKIDLILLDIMMPDPDGFELCSLIKESKFKNIPIIFITAKTDISGVKCKEQTFLRLTIYCARLDKNINIWYFLT